MTIGYPTHSTNEVGEIMTKRNGKQRKEGLN
jgi:hypothetical protein